MARKQVVVIGAGFGGLAVVRGLRRVDVDVVLLDRHNYHLFTPLLYEVGTALLDPSEIAYPLRGILRSVRNLDLRVATVTGIDLEGQHILTEAGDISYDLLVVAAGSVNNFFGNHGAELNSFALKDLGEALAMRNAILARFEQAWLAEDPEERRRLTTFVVIGGGPTGVEFAGALHELVYLVLRRDFPGLDINQVQIRLVEAAPHVLGAFSPSLRAYAARALQRKGVEVVLDAPVAAIREGEVELRDGRTIPAGLVIWAAGVKPSPLTAMLGVDLTRTGRVPVEPTLQLPGHPEVFVIGDVAEVLHEGKALPPLAGVALQEGRAVARNIVALTQGRTPRPFRYFDRGTMATLGRNQAVVDIRGLRLRGFIGWVTWLTVHLVLLITFRSRILVLISWAYDYFFYDRPVRLIVRAEREPRGEPE